MADYTFTFARSARQELEKLPVGVAERVLEKVELLAGEPRPHGSVKLQGQKNLADSGGDCRVIYSIDDAARIVDVSVIRHRRDIYRVF